MTEAKQDHVYTESLKALQKRMELMFNDEKHSDTVFTVKNQKFYAISEIVSVASTKLDAVISEHFAHCDDKKIKLYDVKCEKSFSVILQYMYGLDINFSELTMHVLCGVITIAETYHLDDFAKDLKSYLSKVDKFEMDSLAILLNTSRKYNLEELYRKLKVFAYENAENFVKHDSIVQLQYECILDLIKSDWFCAPEIDILKGVLNWHTGMNTKEKRESLEDDDDEVEDSNDNRCSVTSDCETDQISNIDFDTQGIRQEMEHVESTGSESFKQNASEQNLESKAVVADQNNTLAELRKTFSDNVLKSLLLHVRVKQISMFDFMELYETDETIKQMLGYRKLFSQTDDPRQKYVHIVSQNENDDLSVTEVVSDPVAANECSNILLELNNIKQIFIVKYSTCLETRYKSEDSYTSNDFTWFIISECTSQTFQNTGNYIRKVYLECTSDKECDWECTTECQLTLISFDKNLYPDKVLPLKAVQFSKDNYCQYLGEFCPVSCSWYKAFAGPNEKFIFEVLFKSIRVNIIK